ncbi:MAG: hypothetical protein GX654_01915 [Desulfatiglans sp.]|nr:hypothetical protein [Desulfatiglans sp.]
MIRSKRSMYMILLIILLIGVSSRFINIGTQGIHVDETWVAPTLNFHFNEDSIYPKLFTYPQYLELDHSKQELIRKVYELHPLVQVAIIRAVSDAHPPLFFFLNYYWSEWFGYELETIRTPASIYFILTVVLLFYIFRKQEIEYDKTILSIAMVVLSPIYLFFSNFARPYTLLYFLVLLSCYLCYLIIISDFSRKYIVYYIIAATACLYTHYYATLIIASQIVYLFWEAILIHKQNKKILKIFMIGSVIFMLFLPWAIIMVMQIKLRSSGMEDAQALPYINLTTLTHLFLSFGLGYSNSTLYSSVNIIVTVFQVGLFCIGISYLWHNRKVAVMRFWLFFMVCPLIFIVLLNMWKPIFAPRYCAIILVPYLVITAFGLCNLRGKILKYIISFTFSCVGLFFIYHGLSYGNTRGPGASEDWKQPAVLIKNIQNFPTTYVYPVPYLDALYYHIPDKNRIKGLTDDLCLKGPQNDDFLLVVMKHSDKMEKTDTRDIIPFLQREDSYNSTLIGHFARIYIYRVERRSINEGVGER